MESLDAFILQFNTALAKYGSKYSLALAQLVKVKVPNYLSELPIPETYEGWSKLSFKDWKALIPPMAVVAGFSYITYCFFCPGDRSKPDPPKFWEDLDMYDGFDDFYLYDSFRCSKCQSDLNYNNSQPNARKRKKRKSKSVNKMENF